jgi:hypothetical protein
MKAAWASLVLLCSVGLLAGITEGQDREPLEKREASSEREHFYAPVTLRYLGERSA